MTSVLCLLVIVWIEVEVMKDHGVGRCQVDAKTPGSGGQDEDENVRILVKVVYQILSLLHRGLTIKTKISVASYLEILLHDVHHHGELREYQDSVPVVLHLWQHVVQQPKLARLANYVVTQT